MKRLTILAVAMCLIAALGPTTAGAVASRTGRCHDVDADFTSELAPENCTSPLGLCAAGAIKHDTLLKGSMFVTIADGAPSAGMPASEPVLDALRFGNAPADAASRRQPDRPRHRRLRHRSGHLPGVECHHRRHGTLRRRHRHAARLWPRDRSHDIRWRDARDGLPAVAGAGTVDTARAVGARSQRSGSLRASVCGAGRQAGVE